MPNSYTFQEDWQEPFEGLTEAERWDLRQILNHVARRVEAVA